MLDILFGYLLDTLYYVVNTLDEVYSIPFGHLKAIAIDGLYAGQVAELTVVDSRVRRPYTIPFILLLDEHVAGCSQLTVHKLHHVHH